MTTSKSALLLTIGTLVAFAAPAVAQSSFREALATRPPEAQKQMIEQVINAQTGGERSTIYRLWGYALSDSAILYCGVRSDAAYRTTGFAIAMNGVDRDTAVFNMGEAAMRDAGCARPGYRTISGTFLPDNPLCQSASKRDPLSACNRDPLLRFGMDVTSAPLARVGA